MTQEQQETQETQQNTITSITDERREARLIDEFDLVRVRREIYELLPGAAKKKAGSAERVAKFREKQAAAGLVPTAVPAALLAEVKDAGGWPAWQAKQTEVLPAQPVPPVEVVKVVEVEVEVEVEVIKTVEVIRNVERAFTAAERECLAVGHQINTLTGWRRAVVRLLLGD